MPFLASLCRRSKAFGLMGASRRVHGLVMLMLWAPLLTGSVPDSLPTIDSVAKQVIYRHVNMRRLLVSGYMTTVTPGRTQTDRFATAFAPGRCFLDFMHSIDRRIPPWHDNSRFHLWLTSSNATSFKPFERSVLVSGKDSEARQYWISPYTQAIAWHPTADFFETSVDAQHKNLYLDAFFAHNRRRSLVLNGEMQEVNGLKCILIETEEKFDRLWLAPSRGFAVVKRILTLGQRGTFKKTYLCRDFREAEKGLWLPYEVECEITNVADDREEGTRSFRIEVTDAAVNSNVPNSIFAFEPPPGSITYDAEGQPVAFRSGGAKSLLDLWGSVCSEAFPPSPPDEDVTWHTIYSVTACVIGTIGVMSFVLIGLFRAPGGINRFRRGVPLGN